MITIIVAVILGMVFIPGEGSLLVIGCMICGVIGLGVSLFLGIVLSDQFVQTNEFSGIYIRIEYHEIPTLTLFGTGSGGNLPVMVILDNGTEKKVGWLKLPLPIGLMPGQRVEIIQGYYQFSRSWYKLIALSLKSESSEVKI